MQLTKNHKNVRYIQYLDGEESRDDHFENLLAGKVRAGFKVKNWYIEQGLKWGEPEHIIIMTDFYGVARAAAKIEYCETILYKNMDDKLAKSIGYGNGSLDTWKRRSADIISHDCVAAEIKFNGDTELLITWFKMIYPT